MRKNKSGRISSIENIKEKVTSLRGSGFSFSEIGRALSISKQLARYHYLTKKRKGI